MRCITPVLPPLQHLRARLQITINYTAAAANTSGITYSLDAASLAGGNTISSATGDLTYAAGMVGYQL